MEKGGWLAEDEKRNPGKGKALGLQWGIFFYYRGGRVRDNFHHWGCGRRWKAGIKLALQSAS